MNQETGLPLDLIAERDTASYQLACPLYEPPPSYAESIAANSNSVSIREVETPVSINTESTSIIHIPIHESTSTCTQINYDLPSLPTTNTPSTTSYASPNAQSNLPDSSNPLQYPPRTTCLIPCLTRIKIYYISAYTMIAIQLALNLWCYFVYTLSNLALFIYVLTYVPPLKTLCKLIKWMKKKKETIFVELVFANLVFWLILYLIVTSIDTGKGYHQHNKC